MICFIVCLSIGSHWQHMSHANEPQVDPHFQTELNGIVFQWQSNTLSYPDALAAMEKIRQRVLRENIPVHEGLIENSLGIVEGIRSNLGKSLTHFETARRIFEHCGARSRIANASLNI